MKDDNDIKDEVQEVQSGPRVKRLLPDFVYQGGVSFQMSPSQFEDLEKVKVVATNYAMMWIKKDIAEKIEEYYSQWIQKSVDK